MKAMILLGLNCGFGCTDCAELEWKHLDFERKRINYPRTKTEIGRNLPLWRETVELLKMVPRHGAKIFCTRKGTPWVRTFEKEKQDGTIKYVTDNALSEAFANLMKKAGINAEKGTGFYTLRRTAATLVL